MPGKTVAILLLEVHRTEGAEALLAARSATSGLAVAGLLDSDSTWTAMAMCNGCQASQRDPSQQEATKASILEHFNGLRSGVLRGYCV